MNYEEKYKQALERAKEELRVCGSQDCDAARQIFRFFPELAVSEDEGIKDEIKDVIQAAIIPKESKREMLAWLKKQGEQTKERFTWKPSEEEINGLLDQIKDFGL